MLPSMGILAPGRTQEAPAWTASSASTARRLASRPDGLGARSAGPDVGAWPWRRKDRPEDRRVPATPARDHPPRSKGASVSVEPQAARPPARNRFGMDVLPEPGAAPRAASHLAEDPAEQDQRATSVRPVDVDTGPGGVVVDQHVRRALALEELRLLLKDQD